jgi:hypothetical protein
MDVRSQGYDEMLTTSITANGRNPLRATKPMELERLPMEYSFNPI